MAAFSPSGFGKQMSQSISITYANRPCVLADPQQYPQAAGKANSFTNPLGPEPGRGWVLMCYRDVAAIPLNTAQPLTFSAGKTATFPSLYLHRAFNVSRGVVGDLNRVYLCELLDKRAILAMSRVWGMSFRWSGSYNVIFPPAAHLTTLDRFYFSSLNPPVSAHSSQVEWTWQTMLDNLWGFLPHPYRGTAPTLPYTPPGAPRNLIYTEQPAWRSISEALALIRCAIAYDPILDQLSYVRLGAAQQTAQQAEALYLTTIDDTDVIQATVTRIPQRLSIQATVQHEPYGSEGLFGGNFSANPPALPIAYGQYDTNNDQAVPPFSGGYPTDVAGTANISFRTLWNPRPIEREPVELGGSILNQADLDADAATMIEQWLEDQQATPSRRLYQGICPEFRTGSLIKAVCWRNYGDGYLTEVLKGAGIPRPSGASSGAAMMDIGSLREPDEQLIRREYNRYSVQRYPPTQVLVQLRAANGLPVSGTNYFDGRIVYFNPAAAQVEYTNGAYCWVTHANCVATDGGRTIMTLPVLPADFVAKGMVHGLIDTGAAIEPVRPLVIIDPDLTFLAKTQAAVTTAGGVVNIKLLDSGGTQRDPAVPCTFLARLTPLASGKEIWVKWFANGWRCIERPELLSDLDAHYNQAYIEGLGFAHP